MRELILWCNECRRWGWSLAKYGPSRIQIRLWQKRPIIRTARYRGAIMLRPQYPCSSRMVQFKTWLSIRRCSTVRLRLTSGHPPNNRQVPANLALTRLPPAKHRIAQTERPTQDQAIGPVPIRQRELIHMPEKRWKNINTTSVLVVPGNLQYGSVPKWLTLLCCC